MSIIALACLTALAPPTDLPIANPGFELELAGWSIALPDKNARYFSVDETTRRSGERSLRITSDNPAADPWIVLPARELTGGATYAFSAWVRGEPGASANAALKVEYYNARNENTSGYYARATVSGAEWQRLVVEQPADAGVVKASLLLRLFGTGTVWFDDVSFARTAEPPPFTLAPSRVAAAAKQPVELQVAFHRVAAGTPARVELVRPDGTALPVETASEATPDGAVLRLTMPDLPPGEYLLRVAYGEASRELPVFVPLAQRKPRNLTESGTLLVDGKPFFPIGIYHVHTGDFEALARAGFNAIQGAGPADLEAFGKHLDLAAQHGLKVDVPLYANGQVAKNLPASLAALERYADHPAVMDWKIIDEPDLRPDVVDEVAGAYRALKAGDAPQPIELTLATPSSYPFWAPFCDIMQIDPYPLPRQPLTMVADYTRQAKAVLKPWQNLTVVLQSGWTPGLATQPSYEQARTMVYLALIHGAKGLFWYSLRDPDWNLMETPLWARFRELNEESARLGEVVMNGTPLSGVTASPAELHVAAWAEEGRWLVMLANPTAADCQAAVSLPGGARAVKVLCGSGRAEVDGRAVAVKVAATSGLLLEVTH